MWYVEVAIFGVCSTHFLQRTSHTKISPPPPPPKQSFPHDLQEKTEIFLYIGQLIDLSPKIFAIYLIIQIPYLV